MALAYHINVTISFVFVTLVSLKVPSGNCRSQPRKNMQTKFLKKSIHDSVLLYSYTDVKVTFFFKKKRPVQNLL